MNNRSNKAPSQQHSSGSSSLASALTPWGKPGPVTARPPALIANLICRRLFFFSFLTPALELASPEKNPVRVLITRGCVFIRCVLVFSSRGISLFDSAGFVSCERCCVAKAAGGLLRSRLSTLRFSLTNFPRNSLAASRYTEPNTPRDHAPGVLFSLILGLVIVCAVGNIFLGLDIG